jgi:hypothetical protein
LLIAGAIVAATVGNLWIINNRFDSQTAIIDASTISRVDLLVQGCKVVFRLDTALNPNDISLVSLVDKRDTAEFSILNDVLTLKYTMGSLAEAGAANTSLLSENPSLAYRVECLAEFSFGNAVALTDVTIEARGVESTVVLDQIAISGSLYVHGADINLRTQGCTFDSVQASISNGMLDFSTVTILNLNAGITAFIAKAGDVIVGPLAVNTADLTWSNPCGFVCLPDGQFVDDSDCAIAGDCSDGSCTPSSPNITNVTTAQACYDRMCAGNIVTTLPKATSVNTLKLSLATMFGSLYVFDPALELSDVGTTPSNSSYAKPISLGADLGLSFETIFDAADLTAEDVVASVFFRSLSPDTAFLMSTNPVYFEIEPSYISTFSATLLRPLHARFTTTLQPGFCPYRLSPTINERGQVADLLQSEARLFRDRARVLERVGREKNVAFVQQSISPVVYKTTTVKPSTALIAALIMSFVLAAIFGILAAVFGIVTFFNMALAMVKGQGEQRQVDQYLATCRASTATNLLETGVATDTKADNQLGTSSMLLGAHSDGSQHDDSEGIWSIFDVGPTLALSVYRYYLLDAVQEFARSMTQPMLWTDFVDAYE